MRIRNFLNTFKNLTDLKLLHSSEYVNYILNHMSYKNRCCYKMFATFDFTDHCSLFMKKKLMLFFSVLYTITIQMFYYHILHLLNVQLFPCALCPGSFIWFIILVHCVSDSDCRGAELLRDRHVQPL